MLNMEKVRVRIAPSPTGFPHIGTIYQAMFDYFFAKKFNGQFVVRLEDTDQNRLVEGAEEVIYEALSWFGLESDENPVKGGPFGPYRQSERLDIYKKYALELIDKGFAYRCFCTKERLEELKKENEWKKVASIYDRKCLNLSDGEIEQNLKNNLPSVIRMKIPSDRKITFKDELVGEVEFDSNLIDDQVLLKSDGFPTYHLAVVVDDYLMEITHIFRGREWTPSTPKHILLYEFFGWEKNTPKYIHLPLILNSDGAGKLSKRMGHASVDYYRKEGFLPEAILNYLVNIVWFNPNGQEIYPMEEFMNAFSLEPLKVPASSPGPRFDLKKLEWMNGEYIRAMSDEELGKRLEDFLPDHLKKEMLEPLIPLIKERIKKLSDFVPLAGFLFDGSEYDNKIFDQIKVEKKTEVLEKIIEKLEGLKSPWETRDFEKTFRDLAEELEINSKEMFQLIRVAFSGQLVTPPLFESMALVGENEAIKRVKEAKEFLKK